VAQNWYSPSIPNRIQSWNYDNAGNVVKVGGMDRNFTYDTENRQVTATLNGAAAAYVYDGSGLRVQKTAGGQTTTYVYDAWGNLAAEYSTGPAATLCGAASCYLATDHLGSTRLVSDGTGSANSVVRYDYQPFGTEISAGYDGRLNSQGYLSAPDLFGVKYTGQQRDQENGLDWFQVRQYSGLAGRFQSPDPANAGAAWGDPQTWNGYGYVGNNPLSFTDPSGMFGEATGVGAAACGPVCAGIGAVVDIGIALAGIFGFGGGHATIPLLSSHRRARC
jgi:RHS repeat-associated protein